MLNVCVDRIADLVLIMFFFEPFHIGLGAKFVIFVLKVVVLVVFVLNVVNARKVLVPVTVSLYFELLGVIPELLLLETDLVAVVHGQDHIGQNFRLF
jgi:hypothetical protein